MESSRTDLSYEEINKYEFDFLTSKGKPYGKFLYHDISDDYYILLTLEEKNIDAEIFYSIADIEMYINGSLDLRDIKYREYKMLYSAAKNDQVKVPYTTYNEFIKYKYPDGI